jgi:hypothetical protein
MRTRIRSILHFIGLIAALAVTAPMSMAQARTADMKTPSAMLTAARAVDTVLTVTGDSAYTFSFEASGSHNCNLAVSWGANGAMTSGVILDTLVVEKVPRDHQWYPSAKFPTRIQVICFDIRGVVTTSTRTLVVRRG